MSRRSRRLALLAAASTAAVLTPAAAAQAEVYCVNTASCPFGTVKADIQSAIDAAEADGNGADTISVGPKATPYVGPFTYDDGGGGGKLTIIGAGIGDTVLSSNGSGGHTLSLANADSVVKNLTLRTASSGSFSALWLNGGRAEGVRVEQAGNDFDTLGVNLYGAGSEFADGEIAMTAGLAVRTGHPNGTSGLRIDRSHLTGRGGVSTDAGSSLTIDRSTIDTTRTALIAGGSGSSATITNSVVRMGNAGGSDTALQAVGNGTLTAVHVTLLGSGAGNAIGASSAASNWAATAQVRNSIISGFTRYAACSGDNGGSALLTLQYTSKTGASQSDPECTLTTGAGVLTGAPQFAGGTPGADLAAADLRLQAPSPLIDAGDGAGILATDFAGLSRPVDGNGTGGAQVDLGAIEYRREAPVAQLAAPATAVVGQPVAFSAAGTTDPDGDALTYAWAFGDGQTASGVQAQYAYATPGPKTVKLVVTDAAGRTTAMTATVQVSAPPVVEQPAPVQDAPAQAPPANTGTSTPPAAAQDTLAPKLASLRVAKKARLGTGRSTLASRGADLRFSLSEAGRITVTLKRGKAKAKRLTFTAAKPGTMAIALGRKSGLGAGRYVVTVVAHDAAGNRSGVLKGTLRLR
ncbi:PKD domain-containing protein [Svornostia abyssi]|uniref:PKD domain-containing protein n=1 Tax=Svornostia abyssi TaxID=2898438 RepID=A0ABY5PJH3_9ACTN|nr:PKD domain-containing protein [Parviterribacteraceae bacterium J379]